MFIFLRERECVQQKDRERQRQRILSGLCTDSSKPDVRPELRNHKIMTWAKVGCSTDWATQAPQFIFLIAHVHYIYVNGWANIKIEYNLIN